MNILVVSDFYRPGHSRLLAEYSRELSRWNHSVTLLAGNDDPDSVPDDGTLEGTRLSLFEYDPERRFPFDLLAFRRNIRRKISTLGSLNDFDVIVLHQPLSGWFLSSRLNSKVPIVYFHHSPWGDDWVLESSPPDSLVGRLTYPTYRWMNRTVRHFIEGRVLRQSQAIVCLSNFMIDRARGNHPSLDRDRFRKIPGGVNTNEFTPGDRKTARQQLGLGEEETVFLTIRRLVPRMGIDLLIKAFDKLRNRRDSLRLIVGGEGSQRPQLEQLASGSDATIEFHGFVPEEEMARYYRAADFFVVPTRELEGFGLVTVEAMACGTPVIATNRGGSPEILESFDKELLLEDLVPKNWADKFDRILDSDRTTHRYRQRCREYILENYRWTDRVETFETLLEDLRNGS